MFSELDNVIPDVVWATKETLALTLNEAGHLTGAPDLVVEVLSASNEDLRRDKEAKLKLYFTRGVKEYWIADWRSRKLEVDNIISPLLPGFSCTVDQFFPV